METYKEEIQAVVEFWTQQLDITVAEKQRVIQQALKEQQQRQALQQEQQQLQLQLAVSDEQKEKLQAALVSMQHEQAELKQLLDSMQQEVGQIRDMVPHDPQGTLGCTAQLDSAMSLTPAESAAAALAKEAFSSAAAAETAAAAPQPAAFDDGAARNPTDLLLSLAAQLTTANRQQPPASSVFMCRRDSSDSIEAVKAAAAAAMAAADQAVARVLTSFTSSSSTTSSSSSSPERPEQPHMQAGPKQGHQATASERFYPPASRALGGEAPSAAAAGSPPPSLQQLGAAATRAAAVRPIAAGARPATAMTTAASALNGLRPVAVRVTSDNSGSSGSPGGRTARTAVVLAGARPQVMGSTLQGSPPAWTAVSTPQVSAAPTLSSLYMGHTESRSSTDDDAHDDDDWTLMTAAQRMRALHPGASRSTSRNSGSTDSNQQQRAVPSQLGGMAAIEGAGVSWAFSSNALVDEASRAGSALGSPSMQPGSQQQRALGALQQHHQYVTGTCQQHQHQQPQDCQPQPQVQADVDRSGADSHLQYLEQQARAQLQQMTSQRCRLQQQQQQWLQQANNLLLPPLPHLLSGWQQQQQQSVWDPLQPHWQPHSPWLTAQQPVLAWPQHQQQPTQQWGQHWGQLPAVSQQLLAQMPQLQQALRAYDSFDELKRPYSAAMAFAPPAAALSLPASVAAVVPTARDAQQHQHTAATRSGATEGACVNSHTNNSSSGSSSSCGCCVEAPVPGAAGRYAQPGDSPLQLQPITSQSYPYHPAPSAAAPTPPAEASEGVAGMQPAWSSSGDSSSSSSANTSLQELLAATTQQLAEVEACLAAQEALLADKHMAPAAARAAAAAEATRHQSTLLSQLAGGCNGQQQLAGAASVSPAQHQCGRSQQQPAAAAGTSRVGSRLHSTSADLLAAASRALTTASQPQRFPAAAAAAEAAAGYNATAAVTSPPAPAAGHSSRDPGPPPAVGTSPVAAAAAPDTPEPRDKRALAGTRTSPTPAVTVTGGCSQPAAAAAAAPSSLVSARSVVLPTANTTVASMMMTAQRDQVGAAGHWSGDHGTSSQLSSCTATGENTTTWGTSNQPRSPCAEASSSSSSPLAAAGFMAAPVLLQHHGEQEGHTQQDHNSHKQRQQPSCMPPATAHRAAAADGSHQHHHLSDGMQSLGSAAALRVNTQQQQQPAGASARVLGSPCSSVASLASLAHSSRHSSTGEGAHQAQQQQQEERRQQQQWVWGSQAGTVNSGDLAARADAECSCSHCVAQRCQTSSRSNSSGGGFGELRVYQPDEHGSSSNSSPWDARQVNGPLPVLGVADLAQSHGAAEVAEPNKQQQLHQSGMHPSSVTCHLPKRDRTVHQQQQQIYGSTACQSQAKQSWDNFLQSTGLTTAPQQQQEQQQRSRCLQQQQLIVHNHHHQEQQQQQHWLLTDPQQRSSSCVAAQDQQLQQRTQHLQTPQLPQHQAQQRPWSGAGSSYSSAPAGRHPTAGTGADGMISTDTAVACCSGGSTAPAGLRSVYGQPLSPASPPPALVSLFGSSSVRASGSGGALGTFLAIIKRVLMVLCPNSWQWLLLVAASMMWGLKKMFGGSSSSNSAAAGFAPAAGGVCVVGVPATHSVPLGGVLRRAPTAGGHGE